MVQPVLAIHDSDDLYRRLAVNHFRRDGTVAANAFMLSSKSRRDRMLDPDLSVDLSQLTTPEQSLERVGKPDQGIGALKAKLPRDLGLVVEHTPKEDNPAHSSIQGNEGERALELCDKLAEALTQRLLICPTGLHCLLPRLEP